MSFQDAIMSGMTDEDRVRFMNGQRGSIRLKFDMDLAKADRRKVYWKTLDDARRKHDEHAIKVFHNLSKDRNSPLVIPFPKKKGRWTLVEIIMEGCKIYNIDVLDHDDIEIVVQKHIDEKCDFIVDDAGHDDDDYNMTSSSVRESASQQIPDLKILQNVSELQMNEVQHRNLKVFLLHLSFFCDLCDIFLSFVGETFC